MKVILLKDVKNLGRAHETVSVADGHALNYLIPRKYAITATPLALKEVTMRAAQSAAPKEIDAKLLAQNIASLAEIKLVVKVKANEKGHLYTSVGESEISKAAKEQARVDLPEEVIKLEKPIKELGTFDVPVSSGEIFGKFSITIEAE